MNGTYQLLVNVDDNILDENIHTININKELLSQVSREVGVEIELYLCNFIFMHTAYHCNCKSFLVAFIVSILSEVLRYNRIT
jgi:hypothetical protein